MFDLERIQFYLFFHIDEINKPYKIGHYCPMDLKYHKQSF